MAFRTILPSGRVLTANLICIVFDSGIWHHSEKKLTFQEIMLFAQAAKSSHYFDRYIQWLESALELEKSQQWNKKLQKMIKKAKLDHDKAFKASLVSTYANIGSPQTNQKHLVNTISSPYHSVLR